MSDQDQARRRRGFISFVDRLATITITVIVDVLVLLMLIVLVWGVIALAITVFRTIDQRDVTAIKDLVVGVLTVFVIIEIFDLFREYARSSHVKVVNLAEVSLAVVLRELWLLLLGGSTDWALYLSLAGLIGALAVFWFVASRQETGIGRWMPFRRPEGSAAPGEAPAGVGAREEPD